MAASGDGARIEVALVVATRSVRRAFDARLGAIGLNMMQAGLLTHVEEHGSLTQRELADLLHVSRAAAGAFVDVLEERGLVKRTPDRSDRRVWRISLEPAAEPLLVKFKEIDAQVRKELRKGIDRSERQQLARLLTTLSANARDVLADDL